MKILAIILTPFVWIVVIVGHLLYYLSKIIKSAGYLLMGESHGAKAALREFWKVWIEL